MALEEFDDPLCDPGAKTLLLLFRDVLDSCEGRAPLLLLGGEVCLTGLSRELLTMDELLWLFLSVPMMVSFLLSRFFDRWMHFK